MKTRRLLTAAAFFGVFGIAFPANSDDARETAAIEAANRFDFDHVSCNGAANEIRVFAMAVYHDRNANGNFDKTGLGLPAEPWGLSNNPRSLFGPPPIEKTLFEVSADGATVEIELN